MDREERFDEIMQIKRMIRLSNSYQLRANSVIAKNQDEGDKRIIVLKKSSLDKILDEESAELVMAKSNELEFARNFKQNCLRKLIDVLSKVYEDAQIAYTWQFVRIIFKALRMPLLKKRSIYMRNRAILRNYIRICKRLTSLNNCVYKYQAQRSVWVVFNRWLKLMELSCLDTSPGLIRGIKRAVVLCRGFNDRINELGFKVLVRRFFYYCHLDFNRYILDIQVYYLLH